MKICFLDNSEIPYTSKDLNSKHIRGGENVIIHLSNELAKLNHYVEVFNNNSSNQIINNVRWSNINNANNNVGNNNDNGLPIDGEYYDGILIQILKQSNGSWYEWKKLEQPQAVNNYHIVWATTTMVYDVNGDCLLDIIPESDKINAASFSFDAIRGFYYEQQTNGDFNIKFKT